MKTAELACLLALGLLGPQMARANTYVDPWMLGVVEGAVDFCARADSHNADRLRDFEKKMLKELPAKELASARSTKAYEYGQTLGKGMYADGPKAATLNSCTDFTNHFMAEASADGGKKDSRHEQESRREKESGERR